ncbi:MAG: endoribonuclease MazF [Mobilitalea sp.]
MVSKSYIPERGDIVWLDFNPQLGHEQRGRRPALTLSFKAYNEKIGLALFCPITSKVKGYPFEVELELKKIKGSVLSDQIKSLDWRERNIEFIEKIGDKKMEEVIEKIDVIIR